MALEILCIPALRDNYIWLVHEPAGGETMVVDPAVAEPVIAAAQERGWRIGQIWNTHWHPDHTGGNAELKAATGCTVIGPAGEAARIPTLDVPVRGGDRLRLGALEAQVLDLPAHTAGHVGYHFPAEQLVFVGDVLFAMGCGRLFEGNAEQMYANMRRLEALGDDTRVYCAHEYTESNGRFALSADPANPAIAARMEEVRALRAQGRPTVPTSIAAERATNPFMRAGSAAELARLRAAKDAA